MAGLHASMGLGCVHVHSTYCAYVATGSRKVYAHAVIASAYADAALCMQIPSFAAAKCVSDQHA